MMKIQEIAALVIDESPCKLLNCWRVARTSSQPEPSCAVDCTGIRCSSSSPTPPCSCLASAMPDYCLGFVQVITLLTKNLPIRMSCNQFVISPSVFPLSRLLSFEKYCGSGLPSSSNDFISPWCPLSTPWSILQPHSRIWAVQFGGCLEFLPRSIWQGVAYVVNFCMWCCSLAVHNVVKRKLTSQCYLMLG